MLRNIKFSLIIPTLNEEKYIGRLLETLRNQTFQNFEVIVVDGKSTDETLTVVDRFKDKLRLRVVKSKKGASFQRNQGVKYTKTSNLIFLDADGFCEEDFLEKLGKELLGKNISLATCHFLPDAGKLIDRLIFGFYNFIYLDFLTHFFPGSGGAFLYVNKKWFNSVGGFDETIVLAEDFDLVKRLREKGCQLKIFKNLTIFTSTRRLEKEGRVGFVFKMIRAALYFLINGPIRDPNLFKHEFGD